MKIQINILLVVLLFMSLLVACQSFGSKLGTWGGSASGSSTSTAQTPAEKTITDSTVTLRWVGIPALVLGIGITVLGIFGSKFLDPWDQLVRAVGGSLAITGLVAIVLSAFFSWVVYVLGGLLITGLILVALAAVVFVVLHRSDILPYLGKAEYYVGLKKAGGVIAPTA